MSRVFFEKSKKIFNAAKTGKNVLYDDFKTARAAENAPKRLGGLKFNANVGNSALASPPLL